MLVPSAAHKMLQNLLLLDICWKCWWVLLSLMQQINWYLSVFDNHKLMGNKKQIGNNGKLCQRNYRLAFWLEKIISFEFFTFTHFYQHTKKITSFMCESHVSDKLGWCPVSDSNFSVSFKSGNVIKWTPLPPICQSSRKKQVSSSERGSYINISQSYSILQAGETKSYLRAYLRGFDFSRRTSDFQYCLTSNLIIPIILEYGVKTVTVELSSLLFTVDWRCPACAWPDLDTKTLWCWSIPHIHKPE